MKDAVFGAVGSGLVVGIIDCVTSFSKLKFRFTTANILDCEVASCELLPVKIYIFI